MTAAERDKMMTIGENQAVLKSEVDKMQHSIERIHKRIDNVKESIDRMSDNVSGILRQNEDHEKRLGELQSVTASLTESISQLDKACKRLKHVSFGFMALLAVMTVLVGFLGEEVLPKALNWLWALLGI